jgi:hypothetical protein
MAKPETSSEKDAATKPNAEAEPRRRRRHGYRGYPNNAKGGEIHWGSGFAGIGSMGGSAEGSGLLTERTREDAARGSEDEDTLDQ